MLPVRLTLLASTLALTAPLASAAEIATPAVRDPRLQIQLFAAEPDIVTPIGLAIDRRGRLFVAESHTHRREPSYDGPPTDRVRIFEDTNADGKADRSSIFAEGMSTVMNLAFGPDGGLYVTHRNGLVRLDDTDADDRADRRRDLLTVETKETFEHNGVGGLVFAPDGWVYVGMGENLGKLFTIKGTDGREFQALGTGGHVFRCRPDGTGLEMLAEALWNAFALVPWGRDYLLAVDNDPDARPPNRLLDIVAGGHYGFEYRHGRQGLHPFQAWNGELPGTLPMIAGVGEAASGMVFADRARLPAEYRGRLLVTSWGDHRIEAHRLEPHGATLRSQAEALVEGDESFRPVAIAAAPDGSLYFTDWVDRRYPVHKKGRIWKLSMRSPAAGVGPFRDDRVPKSRERDRMRRLLASARAADRPRLVEALRSADVFIRHAATVALARPAFRAALPALLEARDARVRLGALLAFRRTRPAAPVPALERALGDRDEAIRLFALRWAAEDKLTDLSPRLAQALSAGPTSARLVKTYAAATRRLGATSSGEGTAVVVAAEVSDEAEDGRQADLLLAAGKGAGSSHFEAVRRLSRSAHERAPAALKAVALNRALPGALRAEAVVGVAAHQQAASLVPLLDDPDRTVRLETARVLRLVAADGEVRAGLDKALASTRAADEPITEQLRFALAFAKGEEGGAPQGMEAWQKALATGRGDIESGRRVFFNPGIGCARCHTVEGHGGAVGPELSTIARGMDRTKLLQSILEPSREIAPQWVSYTIETTDGQTLTGTLQGESADGAVTLVGLDGRVLLIPAARIASRTPSDTSAMPAGLDQAMTVGDMRDLIEFLITRRQ